MNEKPIIIVFGAPHSMTSMVAKFLLDNGATTGTDQENELLEKIKYPRYEDKKFVDYIRDKKDLKPTNDKEIIDYLNNFATDEVILMKAPLSVFWVNDLVKNINRPVKGIYVMRDVISHIQSCLDKYGDKYDFMKYLYRYSEIYRSTYDLDIPLYTLIAERIKKESDNLLEFCELKNENIDYSGIKDISFKSTSYMKYRINNFWMKRLFKWLKK